MRVLLVSEPLFPSDGTSSRTINFAKALSNNGHEVHIITPKEEKKPHRNIQDINIHRLKILMPQSTGTNKIKNFIKFLARGGIINIMSEIKKLYDPNKPTVVHFINYYMSICGLIIEKFIKIKSIHDIQASAFLESTNKIDEIVKTCLEKICSSSKNIIFITNDLRNYFIKRYSLLNKNTFVVPLSIDIDNYKINNDVRIKIESSNNFKHLIVYHGAPYQANIEALKKIKKIVKKMNEKELDCKALIIGFVGKYVSSPNFITCGYVEDLNSYISAADLAILPFDRGSLGMRVRILDYMLCGVPVIALYNGISGYYDALDKNALLAPREINEIIKHAQNILLDTSFRQKIKLNASKYIENNFSYRAISIRLESIYEKII